MATCSRCKTARMMLEKRGFIEGKHYEHITLTHADEIAGRELPFLQIDDKSYVGKNALMKIRELKLSLIPPETIKINFQ